VPHSPQSRCCCWGCLGHGSGLDLVSQVRHSAGPSQTLLSPVPGAAAATAIGDGMEPAANAAAPSQSSAVVGRCRAAAGAGHQRCCPRHRRHVAAGVQEPAANTAVLSRSSDTRHGVACNVTLRGAPSLPPLGVKVPKLFFLATDLLTW
jgi:hypothetical protein